MEYRNLGASGLKVSEIALGNWLTQGRTLDSAQTQEIVDRAVELGINFFDTADVYSIGAAETALGQAIRAHRRQSLVIATKCFWPMSEDPNDRGLSRKHIKESVEGSLRRLGVEYIDLMQCHRYDPDTPVEETIRALDDLVRQGKVLYWGISMWKAHEIVEAVRCADAVNASPPISSQPVYNLLNRGIETSVIPACDANGIGQIVFSPLAQGVLTGKYIPGEPRPEGSRGADEKSNAFMQDYLADDVLVRVQELKGFAQTLGITVGQLSLAWCLKNPNVDAVIVGASKLSQLEENVGASGIRFSDDVWARVEAIVAGEASTPLELV